MYKKKKRLISPDVRDDFDGSTNSAINSQEYNACIQTETKVYWYRWYILALYSLTAAMGNITWNTWGPIETTSRAVFGWSKGTISLLSDWGAILFVLCVFQCSYILDKYGLRKAVLLSTSCLVVGSGLRCITAQPEHATWLVHCGQIMIGIAGPVGQSAATVVSSTWFPSHQRTTATAIASLASYCGTALSFVIGPLLVKDIDNYHLVKGSPEYDVLSGQIMRYMYIQCGICGGLFLLVLISFPARPPIPPSTTAVMERVDFKDGIKKLLKNPQFQLIAFAYGLTTGVYSAWCSDLALNLSEFKIDDETAGWLGFWAVIAGAVSGISLSLMADRLGALKLLIILLFVVASAGFAVFSLICVNVIPKSMALFYLTSVVGGLCLNGSIPLFFELAVESSYPVAEGINTGVMTLSNNIYCLIFLSLPLIPGTGTSWMNWFLVASCVFCVPVMMIFKERYKRLELDMVEKDDNADYYEPANVNSLKYPTIT